jgi:MFS family permease
VSVALVNSMFPVFARTTAGVDEHTIGILFLLNSLLIVGVQLPVARAVEGHRRSRGLALMCLLVAGTWLLVEVAGIVHAPATAAILLGAGVLCLGVGECLYDAIYGPLVADLAPEGHTGRYLATSGLAWQTSLIVAPALEGAILGAQPLALWPIVAGLSLAAGLYALRLDTHLPPPVRRTPRVEATTTT